MSEQPSLYGVSAARGLLYRCSGSALLSGSDTEARKAWPDRALIYRLICEANGLLLGQIAVPTTTVKAKPWGEVREQENGVLAIFAPDFNVRIAAFTRGGQSGLDVGDKLFLVSASTEQSAAQPEPRAEAPDETQSAVQFCADNLRAASRPATGQVGDEEIREAFHNDYPSAAPYYNERRDEYLLSWQELWVAYKRGYLASRPGVDARDAEPKG